MVVLNEAIVVFFILALVNVMLSTLKSVWTVKGSRSQATLINAIAYGFNAIVIKQITTFDTTTTIAVTILSNLVGVYCSMYLLDCIRKDSVWTISVTAADQFTGLDIIQELNDKDIAFRVCTIQKKKIDTLGLDIFSESRKQSAIIKDILSKYKVKYHVYEVKTSL